MSAWRSPTAAGQRAGRAVGLLAFVAAPRALSVMTARDELDTLARSYREARFPLIELAHFSRIRPFQ